MLVSVNKKSLVVQSNRLIEAKYRLSVEEQKIVKILVSQIQKDDEDFKDYEFRIRDLAELLGMEHTNTYGVLREITKKLVSRVLEFYDQEKKEFIQASWLSSAKYKEGQGTVILHFDPLLKPLLLQLQSYFTKYELGHILRFKGQYTIRFFEFRKSFLGRNKPEVTLDMDALREMLGLRKTEYQVFSNFRIRVLEPARQELLEKIGQSFTWEPIRQGRGGKVTAISFAFEDDCDEEKETRMVNVSTSPLEEETERGNPLQPEPPTSQEEPVLEPKNSSAVRLLVDCGVSSPVAEELAAAYEEPYIRDKIALLTAHVGPVKSRAGFLVKALHEDWKDPEIEEKKRLEEKRSLERTEAERTKRLRAIRVTFDLHRKNHALRQYQQVPESTRTIWRSEFLATLTPILKKRYVNLPTFDLEDPYYRAFIMQYKLASFDLEDYLVQAGLSLDAEDRRVLDVL
jgi:plasmid replication initiation protein